MPAGPAMPGLPGIADAATVAGVPPSRTPQIPTPRQIGRYLVLQTIGAGGMGVVYAAYDPQLDRKVAIKRLRDRSAQAQSRMLREALAMARLAHPNVVAVHEVDVDEHGVYIVMEFVPGQSLRSWLAEAPRTTAEILGAFVQAGHGLAAAHLAGLVHRDFKPDNVLVDHAGRVRVCDFGLARAPVSDEFIETDKVAAFTEFARSSGILEAPVTRDGTIVGTPGYMAPEQAAGVMTDAQADIFSFCLSLDEALHGRRPPTVGAPIDERPVDLSRKVPAWLRGVIHRGLRADPRERWPTVASLLRALADDPLAVRRRNLRAAAGVVLGAALTVAVVFGGAHVAGSWSHARAEERAAARLAVVESQRRTDPAEFAAAFAAFVADEDHRGTASLALAYIHRGEHHAERGDFTAAEDDFAAAYTSATTPALGEAALRSLARGFRSTWSARQLGQTLDVLATTTAADPELAGLRAEQGLLAGDLVGAAEALALPEAAGSPLQALRPVLAALARGGPTGHIGTDARLADLDGRPVITTYWNHRLDVFAVAPTLPPLASYTSPVALDRTLARAGWAVTTEDGQLFILDLTRPDPVRLQVPFVGDVYFATEADLEGDGAVDLYLGPGGGHRGFYVIRDIYGDPRPPTPAHRSTHDGGADFESALRTDLDGDGEAELLAGFGAWTAYDVRAFRGSQGGLQLVARATLGRVGGLGEVRLADGRIRIAVAADERYPSLNLFAAPPHVAGPAAIHLLRKDVTLAEESVLPLPRRQGGAPLHVMDGVLVGDLDGDGREDMLLGATDVDSRTDQPMTLIYAQRADGTFAAGTLIGLRPRLLIDLDGDGDRELLANDRDYQLWVLGVGAQPLPRPRTLPPPRAPVPAELADDPQLAVRWQRVEQLGALGLSAGAARDLEMAARLTDGPARLRLLDRAADHAVLAGDDTRAIDLSERLVASPAYRVAALARSAEALVRLGRFAEAGSRVQALAAEPQLPNGPAATLRTLGDLTNLARADLQHRFDFHQPLTDWHIDRPESVRRDPDTGALQLELVGDDARVLSAPLLWTGGPLALEFELELGDIEWGQEMRVALVDDDGKPWLGGGSGGAGGGGTVVQTLRGVRWNLPWELVQELPRPRAGTTRTLRVRLGLLPRTRQGFFVFEVDGRVISEPFELPATPTPGRYHLVLGTVEPSGVPLRLAARVRDLVVHGALLDPAIADQTEDPRSTAAHRLAEGDPAGALAALAEDPGCSVEGSLIEAFALAELGDLDGARAAFSVVLASGDAAMIDRVQAALRRSPAAALAARAALGPEFLVAAEAMWRPYFRQHAALPHGHALLRAALAGVDRVRPATAEQAQSLANLLAMRGILAADDGDLADAEHDLTTSLAAGPSERFAADASLALIRMHADDPALAVVHTQQAIARSPTPDAVRLRLRGDPALAELQSDPRWAALVADPYAQ